MRILTILFIILLIIIPLGIFGFKTLSQSIATQTSTILEPTPTPPTMDTAPGVAFNQKAKILVHHSDSSFEVFLVPQDTVSAFVQTLPKGDSVVSVTKP